MGRLSKLAFVFIPLTFTTSIFGMNISELGQGTGSLKIFFITAAVISIISLIPVAKSIWNAISSTKFGRFRQSLGRAIILACYSPQLGFWYVALSIFCGYLILNAICEYRYPGALGNSYVWETHEDDLTEREARRRLGRLWLSGLWEAKIKSINAYLEQPGWDDMTFFGRLVSNWFVRRRKVMRRATGDLG